MIRLAWTIVAAAALAACGQHGNDQGSTASSSGSKASSGSTATANSGSMGGSTSKSSAPPTASVNSADASASPSAAVSPQGASTAGTTSTASASDTGVMGASPSASGNGQQVFSSTCVACHGAGVAGAPKVGDKADWGPRIAQGKNVLYQHALQGFTGKKGMMPPKGGNTALPDADVRSAVDYMVAQVH